jgi:predicted phosphoribosyltransferase
MQFRDRKEAGQRLAASLMGLERPVHVLAIPRGGVVVGAEVARVLGASLDVIVPRKLRAPDNPELAIGAVAHDGTVYLDPGLEGFLGSEDYLRTEVRIQQEEIARRMVVYRGSQAYSDLAGFTVCVVDDGLATGSTMIAALRAVRRMGCRRLVAAIPVAPPEAVRKLRDEADEVICLHVPYAFYAVGQFYDDFAQTTDDEVVAILRNARTPDAGPRSAPEEP